MSSADAVTVSARMLFAELRGYPSHGVALLPYYVSLIGAGIDPHGRPTIRSSTGSAIVVDGANAMGHIAATFGMELAVDRASEVGVAVVAVGESNHCGSVGAYAHMALAHGMIGIATSNAMPTMAPSGGAERIVGMNPLSIALPSAGANPFLLDTSFAETARGRVVLHHQRDEPLPAGWALDVEGRPTTDPAEALAGLLAPIGGAKGIGLAVAMGLLSTLLSGAAYGTELGSLENGPRPGRDGQLLMALDVAAFIDPAEFRQRCEDAMNQLRTSRPAGAGVPRAPGDRAAMTEREYSSTGVPIPEPTGERLSELATQLGIEGWSLTWQE